MKYLFSLLCIVLLFGTSCSDDDASPTSDQLVGSCWSQTVDNRVDTFYFALGGKCTTEWKTGDLDPVKQECTYKYNSPHVTIKTLASEVVGEIKGDVLYIHYFDRDLALQKIR